MGRVVRGAFCWVQQAVNKLDDKNLNTYKTQASRQTGVASIKWATRKHGIEAAGVAKIMIKTW